MCRPKVFSVRRFSQLIWTTEQHINSVHNRKCRKLTHAYTFCRGVSVKYYLSSWCQNVVRTIKWPMRWRWECHWCSYRILTSSLTYDWVDPWQHKFILVYMITKKNSMLMTRSSKRLSCNTSYERITYRWMDPCNFFSKKDWKNRLTPTVSKIISYSFKIKFVHASCANAFLIAQRWFRCFCLTMLNPSVNSPKKESESPQFEIAALKKTFEDFQRSLKRSMIDVYVSSNDGEVRRLAIFQQGTLNILQFYGNSYDDPRQEADKSMQQLWSLLNVLTRRIEEKNPSSWFSATIF